MATQCFPRRALFHSLHKVGSTNLINSSSVFPFSLVFALLPSRLGSSSPVPLSAFSVPVLPVMFPSLAGVPVQSPSTGTTLRLAALSHQCLQDLSYLSLLPSILFNSFPRVAAVSVGSHHYLPIHTTLVTEDCPPIQPSPLLSPSTPGKDQGVSTASRGCRGWTVTWRDTLQRIFVPAWDQGSATQADPQFSSAWEGLNHLEGSAADVPPAG